MERDFEIRSHTFPCSYISVTVSVVLKLSYEIIKFQSPIQMLWSVIPNRLQWVILLIIVTGWSGLFFYVKWSGGLRMTLSRKQRHQFQEMREHVEKVVKTKKVILMSC